jgi:hypothetical protein
MQQVEVTYTNKSNASPEELRDKGLAILTFLSKNLKLEHRLPIARGFDYKSITINLNLKASEKDGKSISNFVGIQVKEGVISEMHGDKANPRPVKKYNIEQALIFVDTEKEGHSS